MGQEGSSILGKELIARPLFGARTTVTQIDKLGESLLDLTCGPRAVLSLTVPPLPLPLFLKEGTLVGKIFMYRIFQDGSSTPQENNLLMLFYLALHLGVRVVADGRVGRLDLEGDVLDGLSGLLLRSAS